MMRPKADPKAASSTLYGLACVLLLGAVVGLLAGKPRVVSHRLETKKTEETIARSKSDTQIAKADVVSKTWTGEDAAITGRILSITTTLAHKRKVSFVRLTPQRFITGGPLQQLPYLLVVEGNFPDVVALERDLEVPANRLAVNSIQLASSDSETNKVSANIGIVAHRVAPDVGTTETKNGKGS